VVVRPKLSTITPPANAPAATAIWKIQTKTALTLGMISGAARNIQVWRATGNSPKAKPHTMTRAKGDQRHRPCPKIRVPLGRCAARIRTRKTLYNWFVRWTLARSGGPALQMMIDSTAVKAHRSAAGGKRGEKNQAIGRSRCGRTTKIHALTYEHCRPLAFLITGGNVADCTAGATLIDRLPKCDVVNVDRGYDSDALRAKIGDRGALANIPPKVNRKEKPCFSPFLYRDQNAIERMFCRLKDFLRIATRYDRNGANFLAAVCLAAASSYWL
jgi:transposase